MNFSFTTPVNVYRCPHCTAKVYASVPSNYPPPTGEIYSDGFFFSPTYQPFQKLVMHCYSQRQSNFFWLETVNRTDVSDHPKPVAPLALADYCLALTVQGLTNTFEKELYVREHIWWNFNHRQRNGSFYDQSKKWGKASLYDNQNYLCLTSHERSIWQNNLERLLEMYDEFEESDCLKMAEIYRELTDFDSCMSLLNCLIDTPYSRYAGQIALKCEIGDVRVFSIGHGLPI